MIPDQKEVWERKHAAGEHESFRNEPSRFAVTVEPLFARHAKLLELGCGVGRDAVFFAEKGHEVTATDFSEVIIKRDQQTFKDSDAKFQVLDMQQPLPFAAKSFDVVYANLSLHYYTDQVTRNIIEEIARVLKPNGILAFACKSVNDYHHGNGEEVEKDVFVGKSGHVRHLFSVDYARELMAEKFQIDQVSEVEEVYSGEKSVMIRCVARKI